MEARRDTHLDARLRAAVASAESDRPAAESVRARASDVASLVAASGKVFVVCPLSCNYNGREHREGGGG
ncbi:hypothetical protein AB0F91_39720 [Amycolatopsis sp. NPDC023774]|uniref:hypothetical protein n=1 Tax=Amycolatopsis sp. NPDC023774 TaxID=3155015 RepID=UPI0033DA1878